MSYSEFLYREQSTKGRTMSEPMKLEEIGKRLGITRERVRQIEAGALRKLRVGAQLGEMLSSKLHAALMRELSCRTEDGGIDTNRPMAPLEWEAVLVGVEAWQKIALETGQDQKNAAYSRMCSWLRDSVDSRSAPREPIE